MPDLDEKIFYFPGSKNRALLGFLHQPVTRCRFTAIIFCHPFAEEKNISHAVVVKTSRALARLGYPVLRFDMSGCGDSEGELDEVTIEDWLQDLQVASEYIKNQLHVTTHALWGLRLGAGLSLMHAAKRTDISFIIQWLPVIDFGLYIKQFLRSQYGTDIIKRKNEVSSVSGLVEKIREQGKIAVIGYPVTDNLYESFSDVSDKPARLIPSCPTFILSVSSMGEPNFSIKRYFESIQGNGADVQLRHITAEPFWDRYWRWECDRAQNATLEWLKALNRDKACDRRAGSV